MAGKGYSKDASFFCSNFDMFAMFKLMVNFLFIVLFVEIWFVNVWDTFTNELDFLPQKTLVIHDRDNQKISFYITTGQENEIDFSLGPFLSEKDVFSVFRLVVIMNDIFQQCRYVINYFVLKESHFVFTL